MNRKLLIAAVVLLPLLTGACASSPPKTQEIDRTAILEAQISRLIAEISELQQLNRQHSAEIKVIRDEIQSGLSELRTETAKTSVKVDNFEQRVMAIGERVEDSELRINEMRNEVSSMRLGRFRNPIIPPDEDTGFEADSDRAVSEDAVDAALDTESFNDTAAFQKAYGDFLKSDYGLAITSFKEFLVNYSDSGRSDDAQYYLAECYFELGDFESAVEEFDNVILRYPDSSYFISATYKKALSFLESNQTAQGVILLQQLIRRYPETNEARLAREKLVNMGLMG